MPESSARRARILLVEDYEDAREMYAEMLELAGYTVVTAKDGEEAIQLASSLQFDLMVLDIALPKVDGITVIKALRTQQTTQDLPIISLSASVGEGVHRSIIEAGADWTLDKPCLPDELDQVVEMWLERGPRTRGDKNPESP